MTNSKNNADKNESSGRSSALLGEFSLFRFSEFKNNYWPHIFCGVVLPVGGLLLALAFGHGYLFFIRWAANF